ncbi:MAG: LysR family transcriptional regulator [Lyngbya sp. HA4199-MV5]|jgi:DNA-binding transcriptional LysR family regulator|nr:LysR family transcriptional regulator [Lyngbya sp. HA4199-MV5]
MDLLYLSSIELRQICYFLAIVEADNNFSNAAEYLQIEQPPLSQRIRSLEKRLKIELFDRTRRPLKLTEAGKVFETETRQALISLERAITQAKRANRGELGFLSVGIASSIANTMLPDLLQTFCDRYPAVEVELRELTADQQLQELRESRLNVGFEVFSNLSAQDLHLTSLPLVNESLVVALPEKHPLATQEQVLLSALATEALILPSVDAFPFYKEFINCCEQAGFQPNIVQNAKATWMLTILSLVVAGVGLAILPSNVQNLQRQGIVYRTIQDAKLTRQVSALWRQDDSSISLREFLKVIQEVSSRTSL